MSLKSALYSFLTDQSSVTDLVEDRVFPNVAPEGEKTPYIVYQFISSKHERHTTGTSGFAWRRVQFDIYDSDPLGTEDVFDALRGVLEAYRGNMGTENLPVLSSGIESERDNFITPSDGSQVGKHRRSVDFIIWHEL